MLFAGKWVKFCLQSAVLKILFTKTDLEQTAINEFFEDRAECRFADVIKINFLDFDNEVVKYNNLIFTSINAARRFVRYKKKDQYRHFKIFCVGEKSANLLHINGLKTTYIAKNAAELSKELLLNYSDQSFTHFCGDLALDTIAEKFNGKNIPYQKVVVYQTLLLEPKFEKDFDTVVFFSPSGVRSFAAQNSFEDLSLFSIGETTTAELENFTKSKVITSTKNNIRDLLALIKNNLSA